jgi:hypothetical protein
MTQQEGLTAMTPLSKNILKSVFHRYLTLAIMAGLLWWDLRVGVFYLLVRVLNAAEHLDRLRAIVRVYQANHDQRFGAMEEKLEITESDRERAAKRFESRLTAGQLRSLEYDLRLATLGTE